MNLYYILRHGVRYLATVFHAACFSVAVYVWPQEILVSSQESWQRDSIIVAATANNSSYGEQYGISFICILILFHCTEYHSRMGNIPASHSGEHGFKFCLGDRLHFDWCHLWFSSVPPGIRSHDSSVVIAMGYGLDGRGLIPGRSKIFSSPQRPVHLWVPPIPLYNGHRGLSGWGVKLTAHLHLLLPLPHKSSWHSP
jgi:hypothetical protein